MNERVESLEQRLASIEDRLQIYNLIAAHPLSADTGYGPFLQQIYTEDAEFDRGHDAAGASGRDNLIRLVEGDAHKQALDGGLAHFGNLPYIELNGDEAKVTSYLMLVTFAQDAAPRELANHGVSKGHQIFRVVANRWTVVRTRDGWRIKTRQLFAMDGTQPARELLHEVVSG
jgi:hypothetical protein